MPNVEARILALEKLAAQAAAERARHGPYSEVRIRSFARDRADVAYHPRGNYGVEEKQTV